MIYATASLIIACASAGAALATRKYQTLARFLYGVVFGASAGTLMCIVAGYIYVS